jgi:hypothetical protein
MRRVMIAGAACAAALCVGAPAASADPVDTCETTATWNMDWEFGETVYADRTLDTSPAGCEEVPQTVRLRVEGVIGVGLKHLHEALPWSTLTGVAFNTDEGVAGPVHFATPGDLNATLTWVSQEGWTATEAHTAAPSCTHPCYTTEVSIVVGG